VTAIAQPVSPLSVGSLTQLTLSLVAIVALILAIGWVVKRFKLAAPRGSLDSGLPLDTIWQAPQCVTILIVLGFASSRFGRVSVSTPFLYSAAALSASTPAGSGKERMKEP